jgi:hypothetical protein
VRGRYRRGGEAARGCECVGALMSARGGEEAAREMEGRRGGGAVGPAMEGQSEVGGDPDRVSHVSARGRERRG